MQIRKLPEILISRIAAGEVIERPASVVKELLENSIDANAKNIDIFIANAGRNLIKIIDDGTGIKKESLGLAVTRHATSKLEANNLLDIKTLGFRGEGLASICAVSKVTLASQHKDSDEAWEISVNGGVAEEICPASLSQQGTSLEVRDLFYATPARLKFLKSERVEINFIIDLIKKIALSHEQISIKLYIDNKLNLDFDAVAGDTKATRTYNILSNDFAQNSFSLDYEVDDYHISGFASIPSHNKASAREQFFFVNNRAIKDKIINTAIRVAYQDYLARDRHPYAVIFINMPPEDVDVNIHPTKAEVRFRDEAMLRSLLIKALREGLKKAGFMAATTNAQIALNSFKPSNKHFEDKMIQSWGQQTNQQIAANDSPSMSFAENSSFRSAPANISSDNVIAPNFPKRESGFPLANNNNDFIAQPHAKTEEIEASSFLDNQDFPLGAAVAQIHETYIIAQSKKGLIVVDQHAAHERLVYEKMKQNLTPGSFKSQNMLIPEIVEMSQEDCQNLLSFAAKLADYGFQIEKFGLSAINVKSIPSDFGKLDIQKFCKDLADNISEHGEALNLEEKFSEIYGNIACRNSIRAGRKLNIAEMNAILRDMEKTAFSGQCNHGRPTYVELELNDLEKLFGRK
jgi:DNA mismatch repair protein MutL